MISAMSWVPKGALKSTPAEAEPPSKEEIEEILKSGALDRSGHSQEEEDGEMDVDTSVEDELSHAKAAAQALSSNHGADDIADVLKQLDMDNYDEEDDGIELFKSDLYYKPGEVDPYLINKDGDDDDDDEDIEDRTILSTDLVILCAKNEDDTSSLEVWILEESDMNMYCHHDVPLSDFPLCTSWLDCNLKGGDKGNFVAVGSMDPAIEIWDLDVIDELQPFMVLGGVSKKKKVGKKTSVKFRKGSHRDSVLGLSWNKEVRNVLASASADKSVKIWDVVAGKCVITVEHHKDKVQAVAWNLSSPEVLLSGSFDRSVIMMDVRSSSQVSNQWSVAADVESLAWDPHAEHSFVASLENGMVQCFDTRVAGADTGSKSLFTLHAHEKAVSSVSFNRAAPNLLATGSADKMVKLWDLTNNQPSCIASQNPKAGAIFSVSFSDNSPFLLAMGGSKGKLKVWDTFTDPAVERSFAKFGHRRCVPEAAS